MFTTHYRNYVITEFNHKRVVVALPGRVYPLVGLELKTVEEAKSWIDEDILDRKETSRLDSMFEDRYNSEGEE